MNKYFIRFYKYILIKFIINKYFSVYKLYFIIIINHLNCNLNFLKKLNGQATNKMKYTNKKDKSKVV